MPGVSCDNDTAGGDLIPSQGTVKVGGQLVIVSGNGVAGHGPPPHTPQTITAVLNSTVKIGGIAVVVAGDTADVCGEAATGSANVSIG
tara:strand:+ start:960 stop:1223 length:264 start_codon:yes stop_codon:yes gene_type:complete